MKYEHAIFKNEGSEFFCYLNVDKKPSNKQGEVGFLVTTEDEWNFATQKVKIHEDHINRFFELCMGAPSDADPEKGVEIDSDRIIVENGFAYVLVNHGSTSLAEDEISSIQRIIESHQAMYPTQNWQHRAAKKIYNSYVSKNKPDLLKQKQ